MGKGGFHFHLHGQLTLSNELGFAAAPLSQEENQLLHFIS
jgi:hypothetical protein